MMGVHICNPVLKYLYLIQNAKHRFDGLDVKIQHLIKRSTSTNQPPNQLHTPMCVCVCESKPTQQQQQLVKCWTVMFLSAWQFLLDLKDILSLSLSKQQKE